MQAWDLEELVEDAFVAYLKTQIPGTMKVFNGFSDEKIEYPCAIVKVASAQSVAEDALWQDVSKLNVEVAVCTELAPIVDALGKIITTTRERNAVVRSAVMAALAQQALCGNLVAIGILGLLWTSAQLVGQRTRSVDEAHHAMITMLDVEVIVAPITGV